MIKIICLISVCMLGFLNCGVSYTGYSQQRVSKSGKVVTVMILSILVGKFVESLKKQK